MEDSETVSRALADDLIAGGIKPGQETQWGGGSDRVRMWVNHNQYEYGSGSRRLQNMKKHKISKEEGRKDKKVKDEAISSYAPKKVLLKTAFLILLPRFTPEGMDADTLE